MSTREAVNAAVKEAYDAGLCIIPPREDGSKRPLGLWEEYQLHRPDLDYLRDLYRTPRQGLGVVCGPVSGELEVLDFDNREMYGKFKAAASLAGLDDLVERIEAGYLERTPRGVHWFWRTDKAGGNTKLAMRQTGPKTFETLIETRGAGGYCILAPTYGNVHPDGLEYVRVKGSLAEIPLIDQVDRDALLEVARKLDECEKQGEVRVWSTTTSEPGGRPGDDFEARADWHEDVLLPAGWTKVAGLGAQEYWRRPGKDQGHSAVLHLDSGYFVPFSSSTPFPETEVGYGKFRSYVYLFHEGDYQAAARALRRSGYGSDPAPIPPEPQEPAEGLFVPISLVRALEFTTIPTLPVLCRAGFVSEGGINLIYSFPKCGKTELLAALAVEWADAGARVLYLTEEALFYWKLRLDRFSPGRWDRHLFFACPMEHPNEVLPQILGAQYDVLIVDTLRTTLGFREGKAIDEDIPKIMMPLMAHTRKMGATLIISWHARKMPGEDGRDISGHHGFYALFDRAFALRPVSEDPTKRILYKSGRLVMPGEVASLTYRMDTSGHFHVLDPEGLFEATRTKPCESCGTQFQYQRETSKYCSDVCRVRAGRSQNGHGEWGA